MNADAKLNRVWWMLRLGLGGMAFVAGLDKFTDLLVDWSKYLSPEAEDRLPMHGETFMKAVGVIEMAVGAGILTRNTRLSSYAAAAWLAAIAGNLIANEDYDIAVRDVELALAALALAQLTEIRDERSHLLTSAEAQAA